MKPTILIDNRERDRLVFPTLATVAGTMYAADYGIADGDGCFLNKFGIERKSAEDLVCSVIRDRARFERELLRLRSFDFARVVIECNEETIRAGRYRSKATPKSVMASIWAFEVRYGIPFVFTGTRENSAKLIERWAIYWFREQHKAAKAITQAEASA